MPQCLRSAGHLSPQCFSTLVSIHLSHTPLVKNILPVSSRGAQCARSAALNAAIPLKAAAGIFKCVAVEQLWHSRYGIFLQPTFIYSLESPTCFPWREFSTSIATCMSCRHTMRSSYVLLPGKFAFRRRLHLYFHEIFKQSSNNSG